MKDQMVVDRPSVPTSLHIECLVSQAGIFSQHKEKRTRCLCDHTIAQISLYEGDTLDAIRIFLQASDNIHGTA